ncbi:sporulation protein [Aquaticitalea lipolytica]|jgi:hypothetical protein|uniref:Sporulation protein n=1 Tax=Aquaticitalea lipolytica TaxID=1247562 RepID=A0A8J2TSF7_9FLAO|nr:SPOR domain-containing protein [Aquaticitalea lipolytica]GFZ90452.1 sporulation protein [Aquaticitalea lipolytica]|tara:strand:- start:438 stop:821 length:384 start_codon:yes stop_codon:yes gene_type:complete
MIKSCIKGAFICLIFIGFSLKAQAQEGNVVIDQDKDIEKLLEFKKDIKTVDLYKIQVYSGERGGAESTKSQFSSLYKDWPISMEYETPNYKVWVGNFRSRLEADRALVKVKKNFANAFIFYSKKEKN